MQIHQDPPRVRSSNIWKELSVEPLLLRKSQLPWFERLIRIRMPPFGDTLTGRRPRGRPRGDPEVDPEIAGGIRSSICSENPRNLQKELGSVFLLLGPDPGRREVTGGWLHAPGVNISNTTSIQNGTMAR